MQSSEKNAEKVQQAKTNGRLQSTHYEMPKQDAVPESQKHAELSISIPSLGLFDTKYACEWHQYQGLG